MQSLDLGTKKAAYTGVLLHAGKSEDGKDVDYMAGNESGQVIEVTIPNGTLALAYDILDRVKKRGFRYQPFESGTTIADPAIEIGDNVTVKGNNSVVMGIQTNHSRLMASTLKAPFDEEVNHEWKYVPRSERQFNRESAYTRSRLTITEGQISAEVVRATNAENVLSGRISVAADAIAAEVTRATAAEGTLRSSIQINADNITAKVSKSGGNSSSFAWDLTDSSWTLTSNGTDVFKVTSGGAEVKGRITATSGYIGNGSSGFEIGSTYIRNGMTSLTDTTHNGVYIGTNGIALGSGAFKATSSGNVSANNMTLTGTLNIGGTNISASDLRTGAQEAYNGYSGWNGTTSTVNSNGGNWTSAYDWKTNNGDYCVGGAGWGYNFGSMDDASNSFPINASSFRYQGTQLNPQNISFIDGNGNVRTFYGVMMYS